jgi:hypothetical protein
MNLNLASKKATTHLGQCPREAPPSTMLSPLSVSHLDSPKSLAVHQPEVLAQEQSTDADDAVPSRCLFSTYVRVFLAFFFISLNGYVLVCGMSMPSSPCMAYDPREHLRTLQLRRLSPPHFLEDGTHYIRVLYLPCCKLSR